MSWKAKQGKYSDLKHVLASLDLSAFYDEELEDMEALWVNR